ncbi:hypothetical protein ACHAPU_010819 [Fusarium lateritium]
MAEPSQKYTLSHDFQEPAIETTATNTETAALGDTPPLDVKNPPLSETICENTTEDSVYC